MFNDTSEIKVFSSMPHTHLLGGVFKVYHFVIFTWIYKMLILYFQTGREVYTSVVRNGKEIAYIANNKYYDFNYQYYNFLTNPVVVKRVK